MFEFLSAKHKAKFQDIGFYSDNPNIYFEEKFDGSRFGIVYDRHDISAISRNGINRAVNIPYHHGAIKQKFPDGTVADAEVVHLFEPRKDRWALSRNVMGTDEYNPNVKPANMLIFDIQYYGGDNVKGLTYLARRDLIRKLVDADQEDDWFCYNSVTGWAYPRAFNLVIFKNDIKRLWQELVIENGGEGLMLKNAKATNYNDSWVKVKKRIHIDAFVHGWTKAKDGKFSGQIGALKLAVMDENGKPKLIGDCSGMNNTQRLQFTNFAVNSPEKLLNTVVEVAAMEVTKNLKLRHADFLRLRDDKPKEQCTIDQLVNPRYQQ